MLFKCLSILYIKYTLALPCCHCYNGIASFYRHRIFTIFSSFFKHVMHQSVLKKPFCCRKYNSISIHVRKSSGFIRTDFAKYHTHKSDANVSIHFVHLIIKSIEIPNSKAYFPEEPFFLHISCVCFCGNSFCLKTLVHYENHLSYIPWKKLFDHPIQLTTFWFSAIFSVDRLHSNTHESTDSFFLSQTKFFFVFFFLLNNINAFGFIFYVAAIENITISVFLLSFS